MEPAEDGIGRVNANREQELMTVFDSLGPPPVRGWAFVRNLRTGGTVWPEQRVTDNACRNVQFIAQEEMSKNKCSTKSAGTNMTSDLRPRVVLADDHPQTLHTVIAMLGEEFQVVAAVEDGDLALDAVEQFHPELVILDICMPRLDGLRTARELRRKGFSGCIVFLTIQEDEEYLSAALAVGARAYVIKSHMKADLIHALADALSGKTFISSCDSRR